MEPLPDDKKKKETPAQPDFSGVKVDDIFASFFGRPFNVIETYPYSTQLIAQSMREAADIVHYVIQNTREIGPTEFRGKYLSGQEYLETVEGNLEKRANLPIALPGKNNEMLEIPSESYAPTALSQYQGPVALRARWQGRKSVSAILDDCWLIAMLKETEDCPIPPGTSIERIVNGSRPFGARFHVTGEQRPYDFQGVLKHIDYTYYQARGRQVWGDQFVPFFRYG